MVLNDIIAWVNSNFAQLGVGALTVLEFAKMIGNRLNFNKVYASTVTPITSSNNVVFNKVAEVIPLVKDLIKEVKGLRSENGALRKDNEALAQVSVTAMSLLPIPTEAKKEVFKSLSKIQIVGQESLDVLGKMISIKEKQDANVQLVNDEAINALKNGV